MAGKSWDCIFTDKERIRGQLAGCNKMLAHCESSNCLHHERPLLNPIDTAERSSHAFEDLPSMLHTQAPVLHRKDYGKLVDEE
ncbi:hypothetical protein NC651_037412 [Populus alba x Populus x berolinensis]|nr:hypothetical protein NC651_037412 [Populus alba x Populus x berolinensis]